MKKLITYLLCLALTGAALANPGAHGPNGEHLDAPASAAGTASTVPRVETFSELFELVGHLSGGELSILIDRYDTNAPVLNGSVEVQYKNMKARAKFHADIGDYAIDDEKFLKALSTPGKHALLFTVIADGESDLLEGTLNVAAAPHEPEQRMGWWWWPPICILVIAALVAVGLRLRQRQG
ncbi:hypothetical protein ABT364_19545 [Massilia sp. SR12]